MSACTQYERARRGPLTETDETKVPSMRHREANLTKERTFLEMRSMSESFPVDVAYAFMSQRPSSKIISKRAVFHGQSYRMKAPNNCKRLH